jgi:hypothetical protein
MLMTIQDWILYWMMYLAAEVDKHHKSTVDAVHCLFKVFLFADHLMPRTHASLIRSSIGWCEID